MNRKNCLIVFVILQIIFSSATMKVAKQDEGPIMKQKNDSEYYWFSICVMIGSFDEKNHHDAGYTSKYELNHTKGITFGLLRDNENPEDETLKLLRMTNATVRIIPTYHDATMGYIGDTLLCVISRDCIIK